MNRFSLVAATLALSLFCTPNVVSATNSLPQTPSEWMDLLEKQSINQEDYGNSGRNFVTDSLPLVKDSAQKPDPNVIKIMIDPGHANLDHPLGMSLSSLLVHQGLPVLLSSSWRVSKS